MYEAKKLRDKFNKELAHLQEECDHSEAKWMPYMWAPGHYGADMLVCQNCEKILERKKLVFSEFTTKDEDEDG